MAAGDWNITLEQGATFERTLTVTKNDALLDLSGYTAAMQIRTSVGASTALVSLTDADGLTLGGSDGTIGLTIDPDDEAFADFRSGVHDIKLTSSEDKPMRLLRGRVNYSRAVTR